MGVLFFDVGNTQIKWQYQEGQEQLVRGAVPSVEIAGNWLACLKRDVPEPEAIAVSCVKSAEYQARLVMLLRATFDVDPFVAVVTRQACGVTCSYQEPARLGIDRWLAMIAVRSQVSGAFCVVDCGSAVTIDWVNDQGIHLGGFIVAGLRLSITALLSGTDQVVVDDDRLQHAGVDPGKNTTDAVYNGAVSGVVSQVESAYQKLLQFSAAEPILILTGGDAELLSGKLNVPHNLVNDLVFDGLKMLYAVSQE